MFLISLFRSFFFRTPPRGCCFEGRISISRSNCVFVFSIVCPESIGCWESKEETGSDPWCLFYHGHVLSLVSVLSRSASLVSQRFDETWRDLRGENVFSFFSFLRKRKLWFRSFVVLRGVRKILLDFVKERFKKVVLERKFETSCSFNYGTSFTELDDRISDEKLNDQSSRYPTLKLNVIGVDFIFPCCSPSY